MMTKPPPADRVTPGVVIQELMIGRGTLAREGDHVVVHYVARLLDGREFDSTRERRRPAEFSIGVGMVLDGLQQGLRGMRVGGMRKLTVPAELAFGVSAQGVAAPPDATLVYDVELLKVT
jgi:FKBP-type peptidyl-prolyl cis-trans isomerase